MNSSTIPVGTCSSCFEETNPIESDSQDEEAGCGWWKTKKEIYGVVLAESVMFALLMIICLLLAIFAPRAFWILLPFAVVQFIPLFVVLFFTDDQLSRKKRLFLFVCHGLIAFVESCVAFGVLLWATFFWKLRPETTGSEEILNMQKVVLGSVLVVHAAMQLILAVVIICKKNVEDLKVKKPEEASLSTSSCSKKKTPLYGHIVMSPGHSLKEFGVPEANQNTFPMNPIFPMNPSISSSAVPSASSSSFCQHAPSFMNCECKKMTKSLAQMFKEAARKEELKKKPVVNMPAAPSQMTALSERYYASLNGQSTPNSARSFGDTSHPVGFESSAPSSRVRGGMDHRIQWRISEEHVLTSVYVEPQLR
ncbi:hypothetical protein L596_023081 [Steinernema carpocapsae]|uniref:Uncharacterized protein n=1 Tax=Steinernema carpocapsae TaxID=34508 RepID=A0A4U5MCJ9_STECR|nr:hypothetical protein L596_023081 [Steinernema carpocapsae]